MTVEIVPTNPAGVAVVVVARPGVVDGAVVVAGTTGAAAERTGGGRWVRADACVPPLPQEASATHDEKPMAPSTPAAGRERRTARDHSGAAVAVLLAAGVVLGAACGAGGFRAVRHRAAPPFRDQAARAEGSTTPTSAAPPTTTTSLPSAPPSTAPAPSPAGAGGSGSSGSGGQLLTVTASGYATAVATFAAYGRTPAGGWQPVFGPWQANIGTAGFAPPGEKREGDGRTPSGTFGFSFFFGDQANPGGIKFPFREATPSVYWDDDPSSSNYNQWVDESAQGTAAAGADPEPMYNEPAYDYGAVIAYNSSPVVAGAGSAIFLHVSSGHPTAGCVALPAGDLLAVLRWLDPAQQPRIQMGVG